MYIRLIGILLVSRSELVEEGTVEVFLYYGFHALSFLDVKFQVLSGKIIMW